MKRLMKQKKVRKVTTKVTPKKATKDYSPHKYIVLEPGGRK